MAQIGVGRIATVSRRFWAMDRDNRWPRVERAYRAIVFGEGPVFRSAGDAVEYYYAHPSEPSMNGDEFVSDPATRLAEDDRVLILSADAGG